MGMVISWFDDVREVWRQVGNSTTKQSTFYPTSPDHPDGSVDLGPLPVLLSDPFNKLFDFPFMRALGSPTVTTVDVVIGDYTITVVSTAVFVVGEKVGVFDIVGRYYVGTLLSKTATTLTLDAPLDYVFLTGVNVLSLSNKMNVDGSVTPVSFVVRAGEPPNSLIYLDVTHISLSMFCGTYPYPGLAGDGPALINGTVLRHVKRDGEVRNIYNVKQNSGLAVIGEYMVTPDWIPIGPPIDYALFSKIRFAGTENHGAVIRLEPGDELEVLIQDDLTGLDSLELFAIGHVADEKVYK